MGKVRVAWMIVPIGAAAAWMGLGSLHDMQTADSLVPILVSTQWWTPFYWGQDRFGMLVPLLSWPVRHPLANLLVQGWLMSVAGLLAPWLVARFTQARGWLAAGAAANLLFMVATSPAVQFDWFVTQPYGLAISLGYGSLLVGDGSSGRLGRSAAVGLMLLAHWVNVLVIILLVPAIVARRRSVGRGLAVAAVGAVGGALLSRLAAVPSTPTGLARGDQWPSGWIGLLTSASGTIAHPAAVAVMAVVAAAAVLYLWAQAKKPVIAAAGVVTAASVAAWLVVGTSDWVRLNLYSARYMYPSLLFLAVAMGIVLSELVGRHQRFAAPAAAAALTVLVMVLYGPPSLTRLSRQIDARFGQMTPAVLTANATVIAGDYWTVWPAVFHANLERYRRTGSSGVFGLTVRSEATNALWLGEADGLVVAAAPGDFRAGVLAERLGLELIPVARRPFTNLFTARLRRPPPTSGGTSK
jgi:hypothetical protein